MDWIGPKIEAVRKRRGWSRERLAAELGVTSQTIFNLERVDAYNLTTQMMRRLEQVLRIRFTISMEDTGMDEARMTLGNDEMILFIRKHKPSCVLGNQALGKKIWEWLRERGGLKVAEDLPSYWGDRGDFIGEFKLPQTAAQIEFDRSVLPDLFAFLMSL